MKFYQWQSSYSQILFGEMSIPVPNATRFFFPTTGTSNFAFHFVNVFVSLVRYRYWMELAPGPMAWWPQCSVRLYLCGMKRCLLISLCLSAMWPISMAGLSLPPAPSPWSSSRLRSIWASCCDTQHPPEVVVTWTGHNYIQVPPGTSTADQNYFINYFIPWDLATRKILA
jgi:hypothetical protein